MEQDKKMQSEDNIIQCEDSNCKQCGVTQKKSQSSGFIVSIVALLVAVVVLIILFIKSITGNSMMDPLDSYMKACNNRSTEQLLKAFPKEIGEQFRSKVMYAFESDEEYWSVFEEQAALQYGEDSTYSYTILRKEQMDKDGITALRESLYSEYEYDNSIKEAYSVNIDLTLEGSLNSVTWNEDIVVFKVKNTWYLYFE